MKATSELQKTLETRYIQGRVAYLKSKAKSRAPHPATPLPLEAESQTRRRWPASLPPSMNRSTLDLVKLAVFSKDEAHFL